MTFEPRVLAVNKGGTGQSSYTNGQILIGNNTGNTLTKATLTGTTNQLVVTNGAGSIRLSLPQDIATISSPSFSSLTLSNAGNTAVEIFANGASAAVSAANTGRIRYNSTTQTFQVSTNTGAYEDLLPAAGSTSISGVLKIWSQGQIVGPSNTTTETSLITPGSVNLTLPANFLRVGTNLRVKLVGSYSTAVLNRSATLRIKLGASVYPHAIIPTYVAGSLGFNYEFILGIDTAGVGGSGWYDFKFTQYLIASGAVLGESTNGLASENTTISKTIDVTWQWDTADPSNTLSLTNLTIEALR